MQFTYDSYKNLIWLLKNHGYCFSSYNMCDNDKCVILRHDIDNDIKKALKLAEIESVEGISSTYFVLLTSDFYNVFSYKNSLMLRKIAELGHEIGLHFDQVRYPNISLEKMKEVIIREARILSEAVAKPINCVSMHRPSKEVLEADLVIPGLINSYGQRFFKEFKYLSDSRRRWREPVEEIIASEKYNMLHILTHAFWYAEQEKSIQDSVHCFVNHANIERYHSLEDNITDINLIMNKEEVLYEKSSSK